MSLYKYAFFPVLAISLLCPAPTAIASVPIDPVLIHTLTLDPNQPPITPPTLNKNHCAPHGAFSIVWRQDGRYMAVGVGSGSGDRKCGYTGPVLIFDMTDPQTPLLVNTLNDATDWIRSLAYHPDGTLLAAGGDDGKVRLYNGTHPAMPLFSLNDATDLIAILAYHPDGTLLAAGEDDKVRIYNGTHPAIPLYTLDDATDWVQSLAYHPDGTLLAAGADDRKVRIYNGTHPAMPLFS
ncbi:WD40 repeat domain-containing protein, partial [Endozoicomonas sp. SESOKO3]|uniref:WD40 repeat domain-containing protein n=1 Tax=Endozoicomonas sp. SESOKO3 TaxID=2828744 RepID=UPI0021481768